jgi:hypothetical protein
MLPACNAGSGAIPSEVPARSYVRLRMCRFGWLENGFTAGDFHQHALMDSQLRISGRVLGFRLQLLGDPLVERTFRVLDSLKRCTRDSSDQLARLLTWRSRSDVSASTLCQAGKIRVVPTISRYEESVQLKLGPSPLALSR